MLSLASLIFALLVSAVVGQSVPPTFGPNTQVSGPPADPATPANFGFYQPSSAATNKLSKYTNFIEITLASNSFDYVFGAYPGAVGINDYLSGLQSGKYTPQQYPSNPSASRQLSTTYPCMPYDFQGCTTKGAKAPCALNNSYLATYAASVNSNCLPLSPIEMSSIINLVNNDNSGGDVAQGDADTAAWNTDPDHGNLLNYFYSQNGGKMNGYIFWGENGLSNVNNPGFPLYGARTGGTAFSYYNLSLPINANIDSGVVPYLYQLAQNYTLFDNFFRSTNGASDITYLAQFAGRLPAWGADGYTCALPTDPIYGANATAPYQMIPCQYGTDGIVTTASFSGKCNVISSTDCTWVAEIDGYLPKFFPRANSSLTTCQAQSAAPLPGATFAQAKGNGWAIPLPATFQTLGTQLDGVGQPWAIYGMGLDSKVKGNFCDPEYSSYSGHNNALHYLQQFQDPTSAYFQTHFRDDNQFFADLTGSTLPAWSQITFNEVYDGAVSDSNLAAFETQLKRHMNAIMASSYWQSNSTMIIVHGLDNGMLWDHVAPYAGDRTGPGARTPMLVISPDHANGGVNHYPYETFSLRKMIQTRFGLGNNLMTPTRFLAARDLTNSFDDVNAVYANQCANGQNSNATQCQNGNTYTATASLCLIFYSLPGSPEFPWSSAVQLTVTYITTPVTGPLGSAVQLTAATGTRIFTNKFGQSTTATVTLMRTATSGSGRSSGASDNLLYLGGALPFDANGITLYLNQNNQTLPGRGPTETYGQLRYYAQSAALSAPGLSNVTATYITEDISSRIDPSGSAFLSSVNGFKNITLGGGNANIGAVQYATCRAPISFANGIRSPVNPSNANGGVRVGFSYFVSDGATYTITTNLTLTMQSALASNVDALGNQYQIVVGATGTRVYVYLPTGAMVTSAINGLAGGAYAFADQRFYPYALLGSGAGIYSINTAPFVDYDGIEFNINPAAPAAGLPPGVGMQYNATSIYTEARELSPVLVDGYFSPSNGFNSSGPTGVPALAYQQQMYAVLP